MMNVYWQGGFAGLLAMVYLSSNIGCAKPPMESGPDCDETVTSVSVDESTPLQWSASDVLAETNAGIGNAQVDIADIEATQNLQMTFELSNGSINYIDSVATEWNDRPNVYKCECRVEIEAEMQFSVDDDSFDEVVSGKLIAFEDKRIEFVHDSVSIEELAGNLSVEDFFPLENAEFAGYLLSDYESVTVTFSALMDAEQSNGSVILNAFGEAGSGGNINEDWNDEFVLADWYGGSVSLD